MARTMSSLARAPTHLQLGHPSRPLELRAHCQACRGNDGVHAKYRARNQRHDGHIDRDQHSLSPEGPGPKAFGSNVHDTCFPKNFRAPNNIVKYDNETNPSVWLEDYRLACRAGRADNDLFIIQFLPIYLVDTSRA
jgi:hypothetical protein